jgi:hypothetical protein
MQSLGGTLSGVDRYTLGQKALSVIKSSAALILEALIKRNMPDVCSMFCQK